MSDFHLGEYQDLFILEAREQLATLNENLLQLENDPENDNVLNNVFRVAHTLKSGAAFVGLQKLSDLAHTMEDVLDAIRNNKINLSEHIIDILFTTFDIITEVIDSIEQGKKPILDFTMVVRQLDAVIAQDSSAETPPVHSLMISDSDKQHIAAEQQLGKTAYEIVVFIDPTAQIRWMRAELVINSLSGIAEVITTFPAVSDLKNDDFGESITALIVTDKEEKEIYNKADISSVTKIEIHKINIENTVHPAVHERDTKTGAQKNKTAKKNITERYHGIESETIRVNINKLDMLMNLVGELVITNAGFGVLREKIQNEHGTMPFVTELGSRIESVNRLANELQNAVMKTRMIPISQVFNRFPRIVRDISHEMNKDIKLHIRGQDTELDKKVIDNLSEPLIHMVKNSIDHGLESSEERRQQGKSETGNITLNAYQEGNHIIVEVIDDGRGLDQKAIIQRAVSKGLVDPGEVQNLTEQEIYEFIFIPGFSTAKNITGISGRGVGMDFVRTRIAHLNGLIEIESKPNAGTRFAIRLPLTMAIISTMLTEVAGDIYAIPLASINESIKINYTELDSIEGREVLYYRDEVVPVIRLDEYFEFIKERDTNKTILSIIVISIGNHKLGIVVDRLLKIEEVVIKSLDQHYRTIRGLSGAAILGDGRVALIIDPTSIISHTKSKKKTGTIQVSDIPDAGAIAVVHAAEGKLEEAQHYVEMESGNNADAVVPDNTDTASLGKSESADALENDTPPDSIDTAARQKPVPQTEQNTTEKSSSASLKITDEQLAKIASLGTIAMTNCAMSLSQLLSSTIRLSIPDTKMIKVTDLMEEVGGEEEVIAAVMVKLEGDIIGDAVFLLHERDAFYLIDLIKQQPPGTNTELTEENLSALTEITNIVATTFLNSLAEKTNLTIMPTVPLFSMDMSAAILDSLIAYHSMYTDNVLVLNADFMQEHGTFKGNFYVIPNTESLQRLIKITQTMKL